MAVTVGRSILISSSTLLYVTAMSMLPIFWAVREHRHWRLAAYVVVSSGSLTGGSVEWTTS